ncbi:MarR family transcriptional regulator [Schaalia sp. ZJ405]|uniref:sugar-binding transcriptional regulator n=1 Tax=Schaalia sp. ZJ405 TaxID=2709403 RepID=UPI0013EACA2E|nr:sugar-binding domain-containing protein [Schaalia sp. ZJ405]QPK81277.1 MarR family transcriptional regulator [Schaalia sp. ZJ405]
MNVASESHSAWSAIPLEKLRLMTRVSKLYHEQHLKQSEIATVLGISQSRVSRILRRATRVGLVRTVVVIPPDVHSDLESELEKKFGIERAVVITSQPTEDGLIRALGAAAAAYVETTVNDVDILGFSSWSASLLASVDALEQSSTVKADKVVQVIGGSGESTVQILANRTMDRFAQKLHATPVFLPAPVTMESESAVHQLLADRAFTDVIRCWKNMSAVFVGVGTPEASPFFQASGYALSNDDRQSLLDAGAVGDICLRFFDKDGILVDHEFNHRIVGIEPDDFLAIPTRVGVCGGLRKRSAIRAVLRGRWINVLITDSDTAVSLLSES